jgi:hypothetical protein
MNLLPDTRFTTDIDILSVDPEIEYLLERYDMNTAVSTFVYKYPENWRNRRVLVDSRCQVLEVYTLSNEDIAITKLLAWRHVDKQDLKEMMTLGVVDIAKIKEIFSDVLEMQINLDAKEWEALLKRLAILESGDVL